MKKLLTCSALALLSLSACSGGGGTSDTTRVPAEAPGFVKGKAVHPTVKIGKTYRVLGQRYTPEYDPDYVEEGMASWYGPNFHGRPTANGEEFNQWALTAAHRTLPMPSMVKVTHMETGKSIKVRVNDRGPFAHNRIIDLSRASAEALGMIGQGVAKVRVEYLPEDTHRYIASLNQSVPADWKLPDETITQYAEAMPAKPRRAVEIAELPAPSVREVAVQKASYTPASYQIAAAGSQFDAPAQLMPASDVRVIETEQLPPLNMPTETGYKDSGYNNYNQNVTPDTPATKGYSANPFSVIDTPQNRRTGAYAMPEARKPARTQPPVLRAQASSPLPAVDDTALYVQVGAFGNRDNAYSLGNKLSALSAVDIAPLYVNGRELYRVRLGPIYNESIARELVQRSAEYGITDAKIVKGN